MGFYTFWQAVEIVDGTKRRVSHKETPETWFDIDLDEHLPLLKDRKEKSWLVEPEKQNNLQLEDLLNVIVRLGGDFLGISDDDGKSWFEINLEDSGRDIRDNLSYLFKEKGKPGKVTVWGACKKNGRSILFETLPIKNLKHDWNVDNGEILYLAEKNLFPKDEPVKFELVMVKK